MVIDSEACKACIRKHCKVDDVDDRRDVISLWRKFDWTWAYERAVACPIALSEHYDYKEHGDLARVGKKKPIWCKEQ